MMRYYGGSMKSHRRMVIEL